MRSVPILAIFLLITGCCSDPYAYQLPSDIDTWADDEGLKKATEQLSEEDQEALAAYSVRMILREAFGGSGIPANTTLRDAVDAQRNWEEEQAKIAAEEAALAERVRAEREEKTREMNGVLTVAVTSMEFMKSNWQTGRYQDAIACSIAFENKTDRPLVGVKGTLKFSDIFGDPIKSINVAYDEGIKANSTAVWKAQMDYNQFMDEDKKLAATPLEKLKIEWSPDTYLFQDGSSMKIE